MCFLQMLFCIHNLLIFTTTFKLRTIIITSFRGENEVYDQVTQDGCSLSLLHSLLDQSLLQLHSTHMTYPPTCSPPSQPEIILTFRSDISPKGWVRGLPAPLLVSLVTDESTWYQLPLLLLTSPSPWNQRLMPRPTHLCYTWWGVTLGPCFRTVSSPIHWTTVSATDSGPDPFFHLEPGQALQACVVQPNYWRSSQEMEETLSGTEMSGNKDSGSKVLKLRIHGGLNLQGDPCVAELICGALFWLPQINRSHPGNMRNWDNPKAIGEKLAVFPVGKKEGCSCGLSVAFCTEKGHKGLSWQPRWRLAWMLILVPLEVRHVNMSQRLILLPVTVICLNYIGNLETEKKKKIPDILKLGFAYALRGS